MNQSVSPADPARCALVWLATSAVATGAMAACWPATRLLTSALRDGTLGEATFADLLVGSMAVVGVIATCWLWLAATHVVVAATRGRAARATWGLPRAGARLLLAGCGVALTAGVSMGAANADAGPAVTDRPIPSSDRLIEGLPLPGRPTLPPPRHADAPASPGRSLAPVTQRELGASSRGGQVRVASGDCLWAIATRWLPEGATDGEIAATVTELHHLNRRVIGPDPDLIRPGQVVTLPFTDEDR